jgi:hypothetical protein
LVVKSYAKTEPKIASTVALGLSTRSETTNDPKAAKTEMSIVLCSRAPWREAFLEFE